MVEQDLTLVMKAEIYNGHQLHSFLLSFHLHFHFISEGCTNVLGSVSCYLHWLILYGKNEVSKNIYLNIKSGCNRFHF